MPGSLVLAAGVAAAQGQPSPSPMPASTHTCVVLVGTGTPGPDPDRSGPATAIVVGDAPTSCTSIASAATSVVIARTRR